MQRKVTLLLVSIILGIGWHSTIFAEEERYISIRNTDNVWIQGVCSLVFRLDNGGNGQFNHLYITIRLNDKSGQTLGEGTLNVPPFGDSDATRSTDASAEFACDAVDKASAIDIVDAIEVLSDKTQVTLPLATFDPQYYQPLKIEVGQRG